MMCDLANDCYFKRNLHLSCEMTLEKAGKYFVFIRRGLYLIFSSTVRQSISICF